MHPRVLVAGHHSTFNASIAAVLDADGFDAQPAEAGNGVVEQARAGSCAVVVLDVSGPRARTEPLLADLVTAGIPVVCLAGTADARRELLRAHAQQTRALEPFTRLTPREADVLRLMIQGRSAAEMARAFVVAEATVRTQIRAVLRKLEVSSQLAAVARAWQSGWQEVA